MMASSSSEYEKFTVAELKSLLASKGMPTSGRKSDLLSRIRSSMPKQIQENGFEDKMEDSENLDELKSERKSHEKNAVQHENEEQTTEKDNEMNSVNSVEITQVEYEETSSADLISNSFNDQTTDDAHLMETNESITVDIQNQSLIVTQQEVEDSEVVIHQEIEEAQEIVSLPQMNGHEESSSIFSHRDNLQVTHNDENFDEEDQKDETPKLKKIFAANEVSKEDPSVNVKELDINQKETQISPKEFSHPTTRTRAYKRDIKKRTLFLRNLYDELNEDLWAMFKASESYSMRFSQDFDHPDKKIGYVEIRFKTYEERQAATEKLKGVKIGDREIEIREDFTPCIKEKDMPEPKKEIPVNPKDLRTIYIGNLPTSATKEMLTVIFSDAKGYDLPLDNTGKPKGHAYIEYETEEAAKKALENYAGVKIDDGENTRQLTLMSVVESNKILSHSRSKDGKHGEDDHPSSSRRRSRDRRFKKKEFGGKPYRPYEYSKYDRRGGPPDRYGMGSRNDWRSSGGNRYNPGSHHNNRDDGANVSPQTALKLLQLLTQPSGGGSHHRHNSSMGGGGFGGSNMFSPSGPPSRGFGGGNNFDSSYSHNYRGNDRRRHMDYSAEDNRFNRYSGGGRGGRGQDRRY